MQSSCWHLLEPALCRAGHLALPSGSGSSSMASSSPLPSVQQGWMAQQVHRKRLVDKTPQQQQPAAAGRPGSGSRSSSSGSSSREEQVMLLLQVTTVSLHPSSRQRQRPLTRQCHLLRTTLTAGCPGRVSSRSFCKSLM